MKILFLALISLSLYANSILDNYRLNGIDAIEKQMDLELTRESYWQKYLKNKDIKFGYIENYSSILSCNKEKSTLSLYEHQRNGFELQQDYSAFTGKEKGDKRTEGDLRTPIGIYNITKKISKIDSFYGPLAFVTSYPNVYDKYRGKNGSGIWIHGLPTEQERDKFTKGCIAIDNNNITCLSKTIDFEKTLIIINKAEPKLIASKEIVASLLTQLYQWRYSWLYDDIDGYLNFYDENFVREDGMKFDRFKSYKTRIFAKNEKKTILFSNINIIPYPESENVYQISFKELYQTKNLNFVGDKLLMVKVDANNKMKIFTEK